MQELKAIMVSTKKLDYRGLESISRLICLKRLAHVAVLESISGISDEKDMDFAEEQVTHMDRFTLNRQCLNCLEILTGEHCRLGFEKIKGRLEEDISFFLEREKASPIRQKTLSAS